MSEICTNKQKVTLTGLALLLTTSASKWRTGKKKNLHSFDVVIMTNISMVYRCPAWVLVSSEVQSVNCIVSKTVIASSRSECEE